MRHRKNRGKELIKEAQKIIGADELADFATQTSESIVRPPLLQEAGKSAPREVETSFRIRRAARLIPELKPLTPASQWNKT
jgi:hypothetical protein